MLVSLLIASIPAEQNHETRITEERRRKTDMSKMRQRKAEFAGAGEGPEYLSQENDYIDPSENIKQEPIRVGPKVGRNDPCPCGSGKKYKHCHGKGEA